ncbi:hypothetical protein QYE76_041210 [Lolium multiflorum]|uniref:Uncharacterized protein n=1 Tax=Lolium multiflorum TaxID=4521 RepID=A0AAD8TEI5_LOLMU|nr:hypothetical protein QYE76_041210 [Lolium multiflorum]
MAESSNANATVSGLKQQDGPEPTHAVAPLRILPTGSYGPLLQKLTTLEKGRDAKPADFTNIGFQEQSIFRASCPPSLNQGENDGEESSRQANLKRRSPSPDQESLHASTDDNSSKETPSNRGDSSSDNSGKITMLSQPDLPLSASRKRPVPEPVAPQAPIKEGQGVSTKRTRKEPQAPSSNQEASNTDNTSSGGVEEVQMPSANLDPVILVADKVKLWPVVTLSVYGSRVKLACQRINLRHAQLPLKADVADKCQRLNEKKAALDAKTDSVSTAELETLRKELEDLEERVRATKQLIYDKEALIASSQEEAKCLKAQLKTDLAEIRALNKQLVTGKDEDDEAEIAEVDRVRADALRAFEAFLQ